MLSSTVTAVRMYEALWFYMQWTFNYSVTVMYIFVPQDLAEVRPRQVFVLEGVTLSLRVVWDWDIINIHVKYTSKGWV